MEHHAVLIIGSGPAGYTAAIYAARAGLNPLLYQGLQPGGQLTITTEVENYPGYAAGVQGPQMMEDFRQQALRMGTDIRYGIVTKVDLNAHPKRITVDGQVELTADAVIIATGASAKWLGLPSEQRLNGHGVSACAVCDGFFFRGQDVAVVGGGDTAAEEATYLAKICKSVHLIVRRDELRASKAMQERVFRTPNLTVHWNSETDEILGGDQVEGVRLRNTVDGSLREIAVQGFFVAIGHTPNTSLFQGQLDMDETGYLLTLPGSTRTKIEGVFAAGDAQDKIYRQAVTAAGTGCMAALDAERWLAARGHA
ncbi:MAG: thioredoxin-disulfide reductase [Bacteroidetes bacterium]|nr:thioredoxin-disulfide reductase [Bacteroidota bacterium]